MTETYVLTLISNLEKKHKNKMTTEEKENIIMLEKIVRMIIINNYDEKDLLMNWFEKLLIAKNNMKIVNEEDINSVVLYIKNYHCGRIKKLFKKFFGFIPEVLA